MRPLLGEYFKHGRIVEGESVEHTQQLAANAWLADTLIGKHSPVHRGPDLIHLAVETRESRDDRITEYPPVRVAV
jgi:hypothetical protein